MTPSPNMLASNAVFDVDGSTNPKAPSVAATQSLRRAPGEVEAEAHRQREPHAAAQRAAGIDRPQSGERGESKQRKQKRHSACGAPCFGAVAPHHPSEKGVDRQEEDARVARRLGEALALRDRGKQRLGKLRQAQGGQHGLPAREPCARKRGGCVGMRDGHRPSPALNPLPKR
jgi:hypothetical protein